MIWPLLALMVWLTSSSTWFRVDNRAPMHPKMRRAGPQGRALWNTVGPLCSEDGDGLVDPFMLTDSWGQLAGLKSWKAAAKKLVESGLWHDHITVHACKRCEAATEPQGGVPEGWFYFHDWEDYQLEHDGKIDPITRKRNQRRRHLNKTEAGKAIKAEVITRDQGLCRYCGRYTSDNPNDHKSDLARQIDHVDPFDWINSKENCVVACKLCNSRKKDRKPEEAGMVLLAAGTRQESGSDPGRVPDNPGQNPGQDPGFPSRDARGGPGTDLERVLDRVENGSGSDRPGSGTTGDGPDWAGHGSVAGTERDGNARTTPPENTPAGGNP